MSFVRLSDVANVAAGQSAPQGNCFSDKGIPFVRAGSLEPLLLGKSESELELVDDDVSKMNRLKLQPAGTIVFAKSGMSCMKGHVYVLRRPCYVVSHLACIFPKNGNSDYLSYYFKWHKPNQLVKDEAYPSISLADISNIMVAMHSAEDQAQIVARLDKLCNLIDLRRQQLEELDLLVKSRFVEMFGEPVANEMGWNTLPLEKACVSIVDCPHSTPNYTNENTGFMCIRTSIVKRNCILWEDIEYISEDEFLSRIKRKKPQKGDVIYTREGAILGIAAIIDRDCDVALGQRSMLLSVNTDICLPEFLSLMMNFDSFLNKVLEGVSGSASPHINVGDIRAYNVIIPPLPLQNAFADFVHQTDKSKFSVVNGLDLTFSVYIKTLNTI